MPKYGGGYGNESVGGRPRDRRGPKEREPSKMGMLLLKLHYRLFTSDSISQFAYEFSFIPEDILLKLLDFVKFLKTNDVLFHVIKTWESFIQNSTAP